ncbi:hypothetical protein [Pusillimonas noertemannii]|uniref:Uncharacterized protein n=1 Tax=Pusillimonas noertemannii TaxID=305977 RepID=A0A2U1CMJ8_9BURK|nr:hypothetical protein [Pusillimonas noertemannii]NYT68766.1 hypothetical protein [Pusillimonas noertemannii]PVY62212.1 hypothetical protein C7440_1705 [Pusillimonas noertemannii]TFL10808.1 hypothetical protein CSC72_09840 [Pusillimonas noertemannii]
MEIKINLDLSAAVSNALAPENLAPILNKHVTEAITNAIRTATGYRSEFSEALEAQFKEHMPHGLGLDDVVKFQHVLNEALKGAVHGANFETVNAALAEAAKSALPEVPAMVSMSELLKMARESLTYEEGEAFYALYEESDHGYRHLYLDRNPKVGSASFGIYTRESNKYSADIALSFNKEGEVYSLKFRDGHVTPSSRPTVISRFDSILMAMYVGRTRLTVDMDADEVEYAAQEKYDD